MFSFDTCALLQCHIGATLEIKTHLVVPKVSALYRFHCGPYQYSVHVHMYIIQVPLWSISVFSPCTYVHYTGSTVVHISIQSVYICTLYRFHCGPYQYSVRVHMYIIQVPLWSISVFSRCTYVHYTGSTVVHISIQSMYICTLYRFHCGPYQYSVRVHMYIIQVPLWSISVFSPCTYVHYTGSTVVHISIQSVYICTLYRFHCGPYQYLVRVHMYIIQVPLWSISVFSPCTYVRSLAATIRPCSHVNTTCLCQCALGVILFWFCLCCLCILCA